MAKIIGNTTATPNPQPDWAQTDKTKADYIKNKPDLDTRAQRLAEIDQADWEEDAVPQEWIDKEISKADFPYAVEGIGKLQKTKGSGYAYDFGRAYNRVYVERSGDGWGGHGRGQYAKFALTQDPVPVPDPDYKDWEKDENGNVIAPKEGKFNSSIPIRLPNSHILVPENASVYNDRRQAMSLGCYEDKTKELKSDITAQIDTRANEIVETKHKECIAKINEVNDRLDNCSNSIIESKNGSLLVLDDINPNATDITITGEPNTKVYVASSNLAKYSSMSSKGTTDWRSNTVAIYPPKNQKYTFSCNFTRKSGSIVGIAVKPDAKSLGNKFEPSSTEASGKLSVTVDIGDYNDAVYLFVYSNYSETAMESECEFSNIVFSPVELYSEDNNMRVSKTYTTDMETGKQTIPVPEFSPVLVYSLDETQFSTSYSKDINKHFTTVENVTELPTANINTNKIYSLYTATFIYNRHVVDNSKCYIVDNRPTVGEPATNLERNAITAYYDLSDGKVYGYLDETLAAGFSQLAGTTIVADWYPAEQLLPIAGWSYAGVIDHIGKDPNDSTIRLLLEKRVYIYQNEWIELTNSVVDEKLPTPDNNGHFAYTVQRRDGVDSYELHLISHTINEAYEDGKPMYPCQIPLRENGIIKAATPKEDLDVANKKYVDDKFASSGNLTEKQAAQVAKINSTNDKFDGTYDSLNNKAFIPTALSHLSSSANYRTVTDTEKTTWNNKLSQVFPGVPSSMGTKAFTPGWWTGYIEVEDAADTYMYRQYSLGTFYISECDISNYRTCEVSVWNDRIKRRIEIDCNTGNWTPYNESGAVTSTALYAVKIQ